MSGSLTKLDLLVVGHANVDRFIRIRSFAPRDRTVPVISQRTELGGTAVNIARAAASWGVRVGLVSRIGPDFPAKFLSQLRKERVNLDGLERVPRSSTPTCWILEETTGTQRTFIDQGAMGDARGAKLPHRLLGTTGWVHVTTGDPAFQLKIAEEVRHSGGRVAADPAQEIHYRWGRQDFRRLLKSSEILFGNRDEIARARHLTGKRGINDLLDLVPLVIMTEGSRGASGYTRAGTEKTPAVVPRQNLSPVGAGDAFRGGFYAAWFAGQSLLHCLQAGTRSSSRWIETGGHLRQRTRLLDVARTGRRATKGRM